MKYLKTLWLVSTVVLAGCAGWQRARSSSYDPECLMDQETVRIPLSHDSTQQWRVKAEVDGISGVFVVDTGADFTVVTPQLARRLELRNKGEEDQSITRKFHGSRVDFEKIDSFRMGGAAYLGFYAPVVNLDHISRAARTQVDGILGNNLLNETAYEIDWNHDVLKLRSRSSEAPAGAIAISVRHYRVYVPARINGRETEFALDTGAYRSTLARPELSQLKIGREAQSEIEAPKIDINGAERRKQTQVRLDSFEVGPILRTNYVMLTWDNTTLGMDILAPWILKVDARQGWMSLETPNYKAQ